MALRGRPPDDFTEAGIADPNDPWGNLYKYLRIGGLDESVWGGKCRRDKQYKPLNSDYDLYSNGKDGKSSSQIMGAKGRDDIIRANNGAYIGLAWEY
jgi:general secretion pathway protein G